MNAKREIVLAFLMAAFLLITPAGKCWQTAAASPASPPCHQKTPVHSPEDCCEPGCAYTKPLPVESVIVIGGDLQVDAVAIHTPGERALATNAAAFHDIVRPIRHEFLALHQLLI
jgi:hypothetical protein